MNQPHGNSESTKYSIILSTENHNEMSVRAKHIYILITDAKVTFYILSALYLKYTVENIPVGFSGKITKIISDWISLTWL